MGFWSRLLGRRREEGVARIRDEQRASFQAWVDLFGDSDLFPFLRTSMPALDEEQIVGNLSHVVKTNGPVFALTLARLQVFSQARFQWTRMEQGAPADLFGTPELRILERPWPGGTTADLLARMEMDVTAAGNCYIRRVRRTRSGEDRLVRMRPDWVIVIMGSQEDAEHPAEAADVELLGYAYVPNMERSDRMIVLNPDEVAHYKPVPDPDGVFTGMSWITPVLRDVFGDNAATLHKDRFFRNAATPNLAIKFDPSITLEAAKQFKEWLEADHKGVWNAYKTLYLGGGADPVVLGKDFRELDFAATQGKGESRLASAAGVPPSWVGFSEGLQGSALNAGNFTAARRRFGDGTMQHLWASAATSLETIVDKPRGDDNVHLWFSTKGIPFLLMDATDRAQVQQLEASTITQLVRDGFEPQSVIDAVRNHDWTRLRHTGLLSVQLQDPGATSTPNGNGTQEAARDVLLRVQAPGE
ncbi:MAG UNVERIFIED_CONTAM: phage portal protein [Thermobifida fusca]